MTFIDYIDTERQFLNKKITNGLKGIAILLVLLGHLGLINHSGAYGVAIFLFLSGFGLTQSYLKSSTKDFINKRLDKVILPYFLITLLWFGIDRLALNKAYPKVTILKTLFGIQPQSPLDPSMWYITYLLIWYLAFYFIFSLPQNNFSKFILLSIITYFIYVHSNIFSGDSGAGLYYIEFPLGVLIGLLYKRIKKINIVLLYSIIIIVTVISIALFSKYVVKINLSMNYYTLAAFMAAVAIVSLFSILALIKSKLISVLLYILEVLGNISYEIYLLEFMILMRYFKVFKIINNEWLRFIAFTLVVSFLAFILKKVVKIIRNYIFLLYNKLIIVKSKLNIYFE